VGEVEFVLGDVDGEDDASLLEASPLDDRQPNAATTDDGGGGTVNKVRSVPNRTDSRGDSTTEECDDVEWSVVTNLDCTRFGNDHHLGERGNPEVMVNYLAILGQAASSVIKNPIGGNDARHDFALGWTAEKAITARSAIGDPGQDDVVADGKSGYSLADRVHNSGTLVPHHERKRHIPFATNDVEVGVTDTGGGHSDTNLSVARIGQVDIGNQHARAVECDCLH